MNKKQLNKFRMYEAVNLVLDTHSEHVGTEGDLFVAQQLLKAGQTVINQNRQVQEADSTGLTKNKKRIAGRADPDNFTLFGRFEGKCHLNQECRIKDQGRLQTFRT